MTVSARRSRSGGDAKARATSRSTPASVALKAGVFALGAGFGALVHAVPAGPPAAPAAAAPPPIEKAGDPATAAPPGPAGSRSGPSAPDPLLELAGRPQRPPGRIATLTASTVLVDEDPQVDRLDAVRSVLQSTAAAVPWLHLAPPPGVRQRAGQAGADAARDLERAGRDDDFRSARTASSRAGGPEGGGSGQSEPLPQLSREIAQLARELLDNPIAWMVGFLMVIGLLTVSLVRKTGK